MKEGRLGIITSFAVHACAIPFLVAVTFTVAQKQVKVVEVDFTLVNQRPAEKKSVMKKPQLVKSGAPKKSGTKKTAGPGTENREAVPPKEEVEPPREPTMVTASDTMSDIVVRGTAATYADASGTAASLQSHGGFPGGTQGSGRGSGQGGGDGNGQGGNGIAEGSRDYNYIRDAIMKNIRYPEEAMKLGVEGKVVLSFIVLENGRTGSIEVVHSSGSRLLDQSAKEAVAITRIGRKVPYRVVVRLPVTYRLQGSKG